MGSKFAANVLSPTKSYDKYKPPYQRDPLYQL